MKRRVVGVIQARVGSTRFPGKMLAPLMGLPILEWVIRRSKRATQLDSLILAIPDTIADNALIPIAAHFDLQVYRGPELDVLSRFVGSLRDVNADAFVRICADNPFIDPDEIDRLITFFVERTNSNEAVDCAFNNTPKLGSQYADGFGAEIVDSRCFARIAREATSPVHREHVTKFIYDNPQKFRIGVVPTPSSLAYPRLRFDVDTPQDLEYLEQFGGEVSIDSTAAQMVKVVLRRGELPRSQING